MQYTGVDLQDRVQKLEKEKQILLELSNDITKVREKADLINLFSSRLRGLYYFTHAVVSLIDKKTNTYYPFLMDQGSMHIRHRAELPSLLKMRFPVEDPFLAKVANRDRPAAFLLSSIMDRPGIPAFLKVNYECGIQKAMIAKLKVQEETIGYLLMYSDRIDSFPEEFIDVISGIAPSLSNAVFNIITNEDRSFLLQFSRDIAGVRSKEELTVVIEHSLGKIGGAVSYFIRTINADGATMSPFIYSRDSFYREDPNFKLLLDRKISISEGITKKVLDTGGSLTIDFLDEIRKGVNDPYLEFWKQLGPRRHEVPSMVGTVLQAGDSILGVLWVISTKLNTVILEGMCAQISIAISNIKANEQVLAYKQRLEMENHHLKQEINASGNFSDIVGRAPSMEVVYKLMSYVAGSDSTVLLMGETGTGKELIARAIHANSPRKDKLMVKVNCAALPASLIESELFGHEKGAFTGAIERRIGKFELANNGTLFLDEIGEMPLEAQVKLLRVLQEKELERIGGRATVKVNVRIIAATNRNLEDEVRQGRFRSDLYYRLNVFPIQLPSLRDRVEDIETLANFFLRRYSKSSGRHITGISPKVISQLEGYAWPGNVRELEHMIERSVLLTRGNTLMEVSLPRGVTTSSGSVRHKALREIERSYIIDVLRKYKGKVSGEGGAADILQIPATTLHSKMKKLGITKIDYWSVL